MFLFFGGQQEHRDPSISSYSMHILSISWSSILSADRRLAAATSWLQSIFCVLAFYGIVFSFLGGHEEYRGPSIHWSLDTSMRASRRRSFGWHLCVRSTEVGQWIMILEWPVRMRSAIYFIACCDFQRYSWHGVNLYENRRERRKNKFTKFSQSTLTHQFLSWC